jgi:hypothetical protein
MLLGAKTGDVTCYFKTDEERRSFNKLAGDDICKYKQMLMAAAKNAIEILDYESSV